MYKNRNEKLMRENWGKKRKEKIARKEKNGMSKGKEQVKKELEEK